MGFFSSIIGSVAGPLVGGLLGLGSQKIASNATQQANEDNAALQREFAQNGIQWRVEDAKKAGLHPAFAIGANVAPASPSYVGDTSMASTVANFGQDISRAIDSTRTARDRIDSRVTALALEKGQLENDLLRSQIARLNSDQVGPPMPSSMSSNVIAGQGDSMRTAPGVMMMPSKIVNPERNRPSKEAGVLTDYTYVRTANGGLSPVASKDVKERIEDAFFPEMAHAWRNNITPNLPWNWGSHPTMPPKSALPKNADFWYWSIADQSWMPARAGTAAGGRR